MKLTPCANRQPECKMNPIGRTIHMNALSDKQNQKLIVSFLAGVLVGALLLWMWIATKGALVRVPVQKEPVTEEIMKEQTATAQDSNVFNAPNQLRNGSIVVSNQPAGAKVLVDRAVLDEDGWVVIHEGTASHIGNALGAARFDKGEHSGVVELLRATMKGEMYRAVLYRDNGDREFSLDSDFPFLENGNQPVLTTFIAL